MAQEILRLFVVSATRKVSALLRQVRVGVGLDLDVSFDAQKLEENYFSRCWEMLGVGPSQPAEYTEVLSQK